MASHLPFALLAASYLASSLVAADPAPPFFDIDDALKIKRFPERPQVLPDGSAIAYLVDDWQDSDSVRAHKPLGRLQIHKLADGCAVTLSTSASDPVWSRSAKSIAFFEGLGEERKLVISAVPANPDSMLRFATPGENSRYSAHHFAPVWGEADRHIVVAEARTRDQELPTDKPYTISSQAERLPYDRHFRDDTLWRLVRFDPLTGQRTVITPELSLRAVLPSPDGKKLALGIARTNAPGYFAGDEYVQPVDYYVLSVEAAGELSPIRVTDIEGLLGWRDDEVLFASTSAGLAVIDPYEPDRTELIGTGFAVSARDFAFAGDHFAAWGPDPHKSRNDYVIPPPSPDELLIGRASSSDIETVIRLEDQQEILQAIWMEPGAQLVIHSRHLGNLSEQIRLWTKTGTRTVLESPSGMGPFAAAKDMLVFAAEKGDKPAELYTLKLDESETRQITRHNREFANTGFVAPTLVTGKTKDGSEWRGLLYLPDNHRAPESRPLVVRAYGRQTHQAHIFNSEAQMHVARGYAYFLPDVFPRRGALREAYLETLPPAVAEVRSRFDLGGNTGYLGGSLGGYAGLVLLTATQTFDTAILRAAPSEFTLSWATGKDRDADLLEYLMLNQRPDEIPQAYRDDSPLWLAKEIAVPTLFLHGSEDAQVPLEHSQWMFQSLRRLAKAPAELRVYPGADHSIVRGSRLFYRDFYEQVFDWWGRYVDPASNAEEP